MDGITDIVSLGGHPMIGKDVQGIFEDPDIFLVARHHDSMYGLIWRERYFLVLQARRGLLEDWIILALFFAGEVSFTASTEHLFDRIAGLRDRATETDGKE
jgi:hypothetical protein